MKVQVILVAGICGCGKTTLGKALAGILGWHHIEADEFHTPENKDKMSRGIPLTDEDRLPWLQSLHKTLVQKPYSVLSCSALKASYREILLDDLPALTVWLDISKEAAEHRVASRQDHYMSPLLVISQLETMELPGNGLIMSAEKPTDEAVAEVLRQLEIAE